MAEGTDFGSQHCSSAHHLRDLEPSPPNWTTGQLSPGQGLSLGAKTITSLRKDLIDKDNGIFTVLRKWDEGVNQGRKKLGAGETHFTMLSPAESVPQKDH